MFCTSLVVMMVLFSCLICWRNTSIERFGLLLGDFGHLFLLDLLFQSCKRIKHI